MYLLIWCFEYTDSRLFHAAEGNSSASGSLFSLCENYITSLPTLLPISNWNRVGGVSESGNQSLLSSLQDLLEDPVFNDSPSPLPEQLFHTYLTTLVRDTHTALAADEA